MYIYIYIYTYIYAGPPRWRGSRTYTTCRGRKQTVTCTVHIHTEYILQFVDVYKLSRAQYTYRVYTINFFMKKQGPRDVGGVGRISKYIYIVHTNFFCKKKTGPARCRRCRAYINCHVNFCDGGRHWTCNLCGMPIYTDKYRYIPIC